MPALLNYSGDDEYYTGASLYKNPMDLGRLLSVASNMDIYFPPTKRARISAPFFFGGSEFDNEKKSSIEVLPDECLFEIFRRLEGSKERSSCACVSRRWLMLLSTIRKAEICKSKSPCFSKDVESPGLEQQMPVADDVEMASGSEDQELGSDGFLSRCVEGKKATDVRLAAIAVGTSGHGGLGKLSIRLSNSSRGVTRVGLSAISSSCPSLRTLSLWNVSSVGDEGLLEIAKGCHSLEKLDLSHCPLITDRGLIAIAEGCPNLSVVNVESCPAIGDESLQAIGKFCSKLQSVSIKDCPLVGDHGLSSLLSSSSSVLTKLKLHGLNITDLSLAVIGHYGKSIISLILSDLKNVTEKGFWVMGNAQGLKKLVSLTVSSCQGLTDVSLGTMGKGCANLKQICLRNCFLLSDKGLEAFAKAAGSLESLQLEECNRITALGVVDVLSNGASNLKSLTLVKCMGIKDTAVGFRIPTQCSSLQSLSIRNCPGFGSASLSMVGRLCSQLRHVDLSGLYGVTDAGLLPLLESCEEGLAEVNLSGCLNLTDESITALARFHGGTLEVLNLEGCRKITDSSLVAIADACLLLSELDLSKSAITDSGLAVLSKAENINLQVLSLSGCSGVSNKSLPFLEKLGNTLVGLNLKHCQSIGSRTVNRLIKNLWRCDILI